MNSLKLLALALLGVNAHRASHRGLPKVGAPGSSSTSTSTTTTTTSTSTSYSMSSSSSSSSSSMMSMFAMGGGGSLPSLSAPGAGEVQKQILTTVVKAGESRGGGGGLPTIGPPDANDIDKEVKTLPGLPEPGTEDEKAMTEFVEKTVEIVKNSAANTSGQNDAASIISAAVKLAEEDSPVKQHLTNALKAV